MHIRWIVWVLLPLGVGTLTFVFSRWYLSPANAEQTGPRLEMPEIVDLGVCNSGRHEARFKLTNFGTEPLELTDFQTSCSCVHIAQANAPTDRVINATLKPGETIELLAQVVIVPANKPKFLTTVSFHTNCPSRPQVQLSIIAMVNGRLTSSPSQLALGSLTPSETIHKSLSIRDTGRQNAHRITFAESSRPEIIRIDRLEHIESGSSDAHRVIANLFVSIKAPIDPQAIDGEIRLYEEEGTNPVLIVPVTGVVHPPLVVSPSTISLPRYTGKGPIYRMLCLVRRSDDQPFELAIETPDEITVSSKSVNSDRKTYQVTVSWKTDQLPASGTMKTNSVVIKAVCGDKSETFSIPVTCDRTGVSP